MAAPFEVSDDTVIVVIGTGAGGGVLANELAQRGVSVVALEAGGRYLPEDYVNDEWESFGQLAWLDARTTSGDWRVARDFSGLPAWIVKAVGGTTTHWAGASLRFQDHEWKAKTTYGEVQGANLLDWPIDPAEMPQWYELAENKLGVTRTGGRAGLPGNNNYKVFEAGAKKLGYEEVHTGRMAINSADYDGRPAASRPGSVSRAVNGAPNGQRPIRTFRMARPPAIWKCANAPMCSGSSMARMARSTALSMPMPTAMNTSRWRVAVCVAGNSFESPRMLLNSATSMYPDGLANSSGQVGRNYMRHMTGSVYATFEQPVRMWRGTTMAGIIQDEARHDPSRGFVGGYELETLGLGLPFMAAFLDPGGWGREFTTALDSYENMAGMWIVGEDMPQETNRVTLNHDVKDQYGMPVPNVHFDDHPNDIAMRNHAYKQGAAVYDAVGATRTFPTPPYPSTHNLGTNRMSENPRDGVCNANGRTHDIENLFISDGSQFTTGAAENPTLTIVALAIRQADHIAAEVSRGNL